MIGGIVLAAGLSERMGKGALKQLLPIGGRPMVAVTAGNAVGSKLDRVVVVTGHRSDEVASAVREAGASIVHNPDYLRGNMTSLIAGYEALPGCDAYVMLLADMPGVTSGMIDTVVSFWQEHHPWAAVSSYQDRLAHPLLLSVAAMAEAVQATESRGVWRLLTGATDVAQMEFDCPAPIDVNTPSDYGRLAE